MAKLFSGTDEMLTVRIEDCHVETREETFKAKFWGYDSIGEVEFEKEDGSEICFPLDEYLQSWRCWDAEPTKEEKKSVSFDPCYRLGE